MNQQDSMLEIEQKFFVEDPSDLTHRLTELGATFQNTIWQKDEYFNHPCRDFGETDEAFRVRFEGTEDPKEVESGGSSIEDSSQWHVTYKGPKEKGSVKIREEIEVPLCSSPGLYHQWKQVFEKLSFRYVGAVEKKRENWSLDSGSDGTSVPVTVTIDRVSQLGTFAEIEVVTNRDGLKKAEELIWKVADSLGLDQPTKKSYLRQILKLQRKANSQL